MLWDIAGFHAVRCYQFTRRRVVLCAIITFVGGMRNVQQMRPAFSRSGATCGPRIALYRALWLPGMRQAFQQARKGHICNIVAMHEKAFIQEACLQVLQ